MAFCLFIFGKLLGLFTLVGLGYIARSFLQVDRDSIAKIIFYILSPIIFFQAIGKLKPDLGLFALPFIVATISSCLAILVFCFGKPFFDDSNRAILAFASGNGNVGYFLLPVVWQIFDEKAAGVFITLVVGNAIYENSVGFFIASRGQYSAKESLLKILKLPSLYAFIFGCIVSAVDSFSIPEMFNEMIGSARGAYSTLGMMMIGIGIAEIKHYKFDFKFISIAFIVKFLMWPLFALGVIAIDSLFLNIYDKNVHKMLLLFSTAPLAANNIVIGSVLNLYPEKVAFAVIFSTVFALFFVPVMMMIFGLV